MIRAASAIDVRLLTVIVSRSPRTDLIDFIFALRPHSTPSQLRVLDSV